MLPSIWGNTRGYAWKLMKPFMVSVPLFLFQKQWHSKKWAEFLLSLSLFLWPIVLTFFFSSSFLTLLKSGELTCDSYRVFLLFLNLLSVHLKHEHSRKRWESRQTIWHLTTLSNTLVNSKNMYRLDQTVWHWERKQKKKYTFKISEAIRNLCFWIFQTNFYIFI